mgnify:CR=1 FL=1
MPFLRASASPTCSPNDCSEGEGASALGHLGNAVDGDQTVFQLDIVSGFYIMISKQERRNKIKARIRGKISGTAARPRMSVFRRERTDFRTHLAQELLVVALKDDEGVFVTLRLGFNGFVLRLLILKEE